MQRARDVKCGDVTCSAELSSHTAAGSEEEMGEKEERKKKETRSFF
jgi:hypothetical protein